jgi:phosphatidate phosphatase APP1
MALRRLVRQLPIRVEPFFGFRDRRRLFLTVRALRSPAPDFTGGGFLANLGIMARLYLTREVADLPITLTLQEPERDPHEVTLTTDAEGFARFDVTLGEGWELPETTLWEAARVGWPGEEGPAHVAAHILAPGRDAKFGIISDIDDTILETGITSDFKAIARNWKRVMAQMPHQRSAVEGVDALFAALAGPRIESLHHAGHRDMLIAHERPVFYVSSSPWNLFTYLGEFKRLARMPFGPTLLRDWGFNRATLGRQGHGSHKLEAVSRIVDLYEDMPFVLVGDDTQKDLVAFSAVAARVPERVLAILIRQVSASETSEEDRAAEAMIAEAGVPYWRGPRFEEAALFLEEQGLLNS